MQIEFFNPDQEYSNRNKRILKIFFVSLLFVFVVSLLLLNFFLSPANKSDLIKVEITPGQSVRDITQEIKKAGVVRSELLLYMALTYWHDPTKIFAGTYVFSGGESLTDVAQKLAESRVENNLIKVTLPEGLRLTQMAEIAKQVLPNFDIDEYLVATSKLEGLIFPDTYFVPEDFTAKDMAKLQKETFIEKITPLQTMIEEHSLSETEIITLASIIEREAHDEESMKMVSGILQNRLAIGMALQADATMEYALQTPLKELRPGQLAEEIKTLDSPYNTYKYNGLPPTPIGNPGLHAILAVLEATSSDYYYYITDNDGVFHYAKTLDEHNNNVARYLR